MANKGRPKKYASAAERVRAFRDRMKRSGYHRVTLEIPQEFKVIFDRLCKKQEMSPREMFCVMVAYYDEHEGQVEEEETEELRD